MVVIENETLRMIFGIAGGGFPTSIELKYPGETVEVLKTDKPFLTVGFGDGRILCPVIDSDHEPALTRRDGCQRVQFDRLQFVDPNGKRAESAFVSLRYELYDDGTLFVQTHFIVEDLLNPPELNDFSLTVPLKMDAFEQCMIPYGFEANLTEQTQGDGNSQYFKGIKPACNWMCKTHDGKGAYLEVFMENAPALDYTDEHKQTSIRETPEGKEVTWNFQTTGSKLYHRNVWEKLLQWGMLFSVPPRQRRNPPYQMYHWLDAFEYRIPTLRQAELMHEAGADVIILHEVWRSDVAGIAFPYDKEKLRQFIEFAHKLNMRIALYIRGVDERTTIEDACDWFRDYLKKDWDGLYADFGGVLNATPPYRFKQHYLNFRRIRQEIGRYGLFYAHLGCLSSAVGLSPDLIDGYTSGEGEMGTLAHGRFLHEALSGAYVTTGTFWTAAFPEYGQGTIIPFMAASGQYPHSPLGEQHRSSSLAHPCVPGINDVYLRAFWKLWKPFHDTHDLEIHNDFNGSRAIRKNTSSCGTYLMLDRKRQAALLVIANFASEKQAFSCQIDWTSLDFSPSEDVVLLRPEQSSPGTAVPYRSDKEYGLELKGMGCAAFLFGRQDAIPEFERPYPADSAECLEYFRRISFQKQLRQPHHPNASSLYCKVRMPPAQVPCICVMPFYAVEHEIGTLDAAGAFHSLGYITRDGVQSEKPIEEQWLWASNESPWISLNELYPAGGKVCFAIRSYALELKCYFHSFAEVLLADNRDGRNAETIVFMNDVEPDRSMIHFSVCLPEKAGHE